MASFNSLPMEIADKILSMLVPGNWNKFLLELTTIPRLLSLRAVSRLFREIISRELYLQANRHYIESTLEDMNIEAIASLYMAKLSLHESLRAEKYYVNQFDDASIAISALKWWKTFDGDGDKIDGDDILLRNACYTFVANQNLSSLAQTVYNDCFPLTFRPLPCDPRPSTAQTAWQRVKETGCINICAYLDNVHILAFLLNDGQDPNQRHDTLGYPLYAAACAGSLSSISMLLDAGAKMEESTGPLGTPIDAAARQGRLRAVQLLFEHGADVRSTLKSAMDGKQTHVAHWLLTGKKDKWLDIDVNAGNTGELPLIRAMSDKNKLLVEKLCEIPDLDPNVRYWGNMTPLCWALKCERHSLAKALLSHPQIDGSMESLNLSPLHYACQLKDSDDIVRILIARDDVDVNALDVDGYTPLDAAIMAGNHSAFRLLMEKCNATYTLRNAGGRRIDTS